MRKFLIFFCSIVLLSAIEFGSVDSNNYKRVNPLNNKNAILSYSSSLKDARLSVVNISTQKNIHVQANANPFFNDPFFRQFFDLRQFNVPRERVQRALGSGVIVTKDGYIVTNNHVVEGADKIVVTIPGSKKEYKAKIIGTDAKSDLAVIKIEADNLLAIKFFDSDKVEIGDVVFAIGNPFGVGETITQGIVSATNRSSVGIVEYENFIQTDAPINPGNSGGALINSAGYLIGINSAIISKGGGNVGIGFAIPSNMVKRIAKALIEKGKFERAYLGVTISDITENLYDFYGTRYGALITSVQDGSAADEAGLKRGDLILEVNGKKIKDSSDLKNKIGSLPAGTKIDIEILRDGDKKEITARLKSSQELVDTGNGVTYQGLSIVPLTKELKAKYAIPKNIYGVFVKGVAPDSKAQLAGFSKGDIIVQIENIEVESISDFKNAIKLKGKKRFFIYRQGGVFVLVF